MKNLTFYTSDLQHNIQKTKIPHVLRTRYSFIQGKPIKASHRRLALEGSRVQESLEWLSWADFPHVHAVWHTQQPCAAIRREWTPFVYNVHFLVLTRNTRERTQNYTATFKFTNISIWWLLASFVFNYWKTLFRRAVHKLLLFPFWPAPFGKGFKLETLEQHSFARIFLPPPHSTSLKPWNSFKLC